MIGYFIIFILVMIVSVYAVLKLHQLNKETRHILRVENHILDYGEKLTDSILSQLRYAKKYIITKDIRLYNQFVSAQNEFNKFLTEALSIADTQEKKYSLGRIKKYSGYYQSLTDKEIEIVRANQLYPKGWYEQEIGKATDEILEELKKLETYSRQDIQDRMKNLGEAATSARKLSIAISTIAIIMLIGISFFITRSITKPLTLLMDRTKVISKGIFEHELKITSPPEMMELSAAFNSMCGQLKTVDKMKSDFFSSISHELRTPLTSIKEGISLLQDGVGGTVSDKQKRLLSILSEESKRLIDLVNSVLDLSKMEAGMMTYNFEPKGLMPLIERAMIEMAPLVEAKRITLETEINEMLPAVRMDHEKILQALRNLIGNAVKFTPDGGRVRVSAQLLNREVKVSVADTGPGITKEELAMIFDKFHQGPLKNSGQMKGTGLGLAIVRHIIAAHGGRVWAESEPGRGSSFIFALPV
jgi:two-component system sensor histidine kinase GlrK